MIRIWVTGATYTEMVAQCESGQDKIGSLRLCTDYLNVKVVTSQNP